MGFQDGAGLGLGLGWGRGWGLGQYAHEGEEAQHAVSWSWLS